MYFQDSLEADKKEILNRLANSRKEDVKALAKKTNRDKDEINRIKREIHSQVIIFCQSYIFDTMN